MLPLTSVQKEQGWMRAGLLFGTTRFLSTFMVPLIDEKYWEFKIQCPFSYIHLEAFLLDLPCDFFFCFYDRVFPLCIQSEWSLSVILVFDSGFWVGIVWFYAYCTITLFNLVFFCCFHFRLKLFSGLLRSIDNWLYIMLTFLVVRNSVWIHLYHFEFSVAVLICSRLQGCFGI